MQYKSKMISVWHRTGQKGIKGIVNVQNVHCKYAKTLNTFCSLVILQQLCPNNYEN